MIIKDESLRKKISVESDNGDIKISRVKVSGEPGRIILQVLHTELSWENTEAESIARVNELIDMLKWIKANSGNLPA